MRGEKGDGKEGERARDFAYCPSPSQVTFPAANQPAGSYLLQMFNLKASKKKNLQHTQLPPHLECCSLLRPLKRQAGKGCFQMLTFSRVRMLPRPEPKAGGCMCG